jgi:hypothetical protein
MLMTDDGLVEQTGLYPHEVYRDYLLSPRR